MKNNIRNCSFISNRQLLEGMRNKSIKNLSRNKSVQTNISYISSRNYQNEFSNISLLLHDPQKENKNYNIKRYQQTLDKQRCGGKQKINYIMSLVKSKVNDNKILQNIQKLINQLTIQNKKKENCQQQHTLLTKIEQMYIQRTKIKKQKKVLQHKLIQQQKIYKKKQDQLRKENQRLHKIVLKQSQMIANQFVIPNNKQTEQLQKILLTQAKMIESLQTQKNLKLKKTNKYL